MVTYRCCKNTNITTNSTKLTFSVFSLTWILIAVTLGFRCTSIYIVYIPFDKSETTNVNTIQ